MSLLRNGIVDEWNWNLNLPRGGGDEGCGWQWDWVIRESAAVLILLTIRDQSAGKRWSQVGLSNLLVLISFICDLRRRLRFKKRIVYGKRNKSGTIK